MAKNAGTKARTKDETAGHGEHNEPWEELGDFTTTTRLLPIAGLAIAIRVLASFVALALVKLIGLFGNLFYFGRWRTAMVSPVENHLGMFSVLVPIGGALINRHSRDTLFRHSIHHDSQRFVERGTRQFLGLISLNDLLKARTRHLEEERRRERTLKLRFLQPGGQMPGRAETPTAS